MPNEVPETRSVDALYAAMYAFRDEVNKWEGEDLLNSVAADLAATLNEDARAELAFQLLTSGSRDDGEMGVSAKKFAVAFAHKIGPDWGQWLYRFAVLVTKLA